MEMEPVKNQLKTPKSPWFIVCHQLCEHINLSGLKAIFVLYMTSILEYTQDDSMMIFHSFVLLTYLMPLCGAILADSYWGKFKTLVRLSIIYAIGNLILTGSTMATNFTLEHQRYIFLVGLLIIAIGSGGIKPCTYTFGGDQFQLPEQQTQLTKFFNRFVMAVYLGILLSKFFVPELRSIQCSGRDTCFPLAFSVVTLCLLLGIGVFIMGSGSFIKRKPENHVIFRTFGCIIYALRKKLTSKSDNAPHWLDHSNGKYTATEISDTKAALDVLYIFIAFPVFCALYEQQFSRWTFQAELMNGRIESIGWQIKPDQMQTIYPFLSLIVLVSFKPIVYPLIAKFGIRTPLQKLILSNMFAVFAFMCTTLLQYVIFGDITVIPKTDARLTVYNGFNCDVRVNSSSRSPPDGSIVEPLGSSNFKYTPVFDVETVNFALTFDDSCGSMYTERDTPPLYADVNVTKGKSVSYLLTRTVNNGTVLRGINSYDRLKKSKNGNPRLRILMNDDLKADGSFALAISGNKYITPYNVSWFANEHYKEVAIGNYTLKRGHETITSNINLIPATLYTLLIHNNNQTVESKLYTSDKGNYMHILWQLPQYVFIVLASTIFFSMTVQFSFTEAPLRIKSFVSASYFISQSAGNLIVILTSAFAIEQQVHEYLFFTGLMFADTLLLAYLSSNYTYKSFKQRLNDDETKNIDANKDSQINKDVSKY